MMSGRTSSNACYRRKKYLSAEVQLNLFESARIRLEVHYRLNQKNWETVIQAFRQNQEKG